MDFNPELNLLEKFIFFGYFLVFMSNNKVDWDGSCPICGDDNFLDRCNDCGIIACVNCLESCDDCHMNFCRDCLTNCRLCGHRICYHCERLSHKCIMDDLEDSQESIGQKINKKEEESSFDHLLNLFDEK